MLSQVKPHKRMLQPCIRGANRQRVKVEHKCNSQLSGTSLKVINIFVGSKGEVRKHLMAGKVDVATSSTVNLCVSLSCQDIKHTWNMALEFSD